MRMTAEVPSLFVIESSRKKLLVMAGVGALMTAASIATVVLPGSLVSKTTGVLATALFGLTTGTWIWRLSAWSGPVVTISTEGIRDTRIATELIPWSEVTAISTWQPVLLWAPRGFLERVMVMAMRPGFEKKLGLTLLGRRTLKRNPAYGAGGLCIFAAGLKIDHDTLLQTSLSYAQSAWDRACAGGVVTTAQPAPPAPRR